MYIAKDKPAIARILLYLREKNKNMQMTELSQLHIFQHLIQLSPKQVLTHLCFLEKKKKRTEIHPPPKLFRKKGASTQVPQHTSLLFCVKRRQELHYSMISLQGIVAVVNQNKFFTNTFTKKTLSFCKGPLSRLVKNKQGKTIPVYI